MADLEFDFSGIEAFQQNLERMSDPAQLAGVMSSVVKRMGTVYLREAKKKTPVGPRSIQMLVGHDQSGNPIYETHNFNTQNMRKSWFMDEPMLKGGNYKPTMSVKVFNTSTYSSYVDDGHRQNVGQFLPFIGAGWQSGKVQGARLKQSWVDGLNITTHAKNVVESNANSIMTSAFNAWIRSMLEHD